MASKELEPGGAEVWRSKGGSLRVKSPGQGLILATFSGDMPEDLAVPYLAFLQQILPGTPRITIFVDAAAMVNYETGFRRRCTQGQHAMSDRIEGVHVLVSSQLIMLAVQAANLVLRNLIAYSSRESFESALARAIAERRKLR